MVCMHQSAIAPLFNAPHGSPCSAAPWHDAAMSDSNLLLGPCSSSYLRSIDTKSHGASATFPPNVRAAHYNHPSLLRDRLSDFPSEGLKVASAGHLVPSTHEVLKREPRIIYIWNFIHQKLMVAQTEERNIYNRKQRQNEIDRLYTACRNMSL